MSERERNHNLHLFLSGEEAAALDEKCRITGLSKSTLIRHYIMDFPIRPRPPDCYQEILHGMAMIGNNINQIAHAANATGRAEAAQIAPAVELVNEMNLILRREL